MQQMGLAPAVQESGALVANFMRNLRASGLSEAASVSSPQRVGIEERAGAQVEPDSSTR